MCPGSVFWATISFFFFFSTKKEKKEGRISIKSAIKKIDVYCMGMFSKCDFSNCFSNVLYYVL